MTLYCIYKLITTTINICLGRKKGIYPINRVLKWFFDFNDEYYIILCSNISFIFMGYLMISNVRYNNVYLDLLQ